MKKLKINQDIGLLILRLSIGLLMLLHGIPKLIYGIDAIGQMMTAQGLPAFFAYGVYLGEFIAPLLIVIGYKTRIASLIMAGNMLVIILLAHAQDIFSFGEYGGMALEVIYLYLFGSVALIFTGGGKYSVSRKSIFD